MSHGAVLPVIASYELFLLCNQRVVLRIESRKGKAIPERCPGIGNEAFSDEIGIFDETFLDFDAAKSLGVNKLTSFLLKLHCHVVNGNLDSSHEIGLI